MPLQAPIVLTTGALARYPLARKELFATRTQKFSDFSRQTFAQLANPLSQWVLNLDLLQDQEVSDWRNFFRQCQGSATPFAFVDPWDNLLQYSEQQETNPWQLVNVAAASDSTIADPFGITSGRQRKLTVSNTSGYVVQGVIALPAGTGNSRTKGITVTGSVYLASASGISSCDIVVADNGTGGPQESVGLVCNLTSSWKRFSITHTFLSTNTANGFEFVIETFNATGTLYAFGAQLEAAGMASPYKQTAAYSGFHPKCYFQTDEFDHTAREYNVNGVQLVIEESN